MMIGLILTPINNTINIINNKKQRHHKQSIKQHV